MKAQLNLVIMASLLSGPGDWGVPQTTSQTAWAAPAKRSVRGQNASQKLLRRANEAYEAKQYEQAVDLLAEILQKQPEHGPARQLLARCLYQQKKYLEVHKIGQALELEVLEPEARYEFAQAAFKLDEYKAALPLFRGIPEGHPQFDLAGYYGGISAFKLADYEGAVTLLQQAVVLPSKLLRSQKLYLKEAERLLLQKQKQKLLQPEVGTPQTAPPPPAPTPSPTLPPPIADETNRDYSYRWLRPQRRVSLIPRYTWQEQERDAAVVDDYEVKMGSLRLSFGGSQSASERSAHFLLQADAALSALDGISGYLPLLADVREEQFFDLALRETPRSMLYMEVWGGVEWPLLESASWGLRLGSFLHSVDFIEDATYISPWAGLFVAHKAQKMQSELHLDIYLNYLDGDLRSTNTRQKARVELGLPANFAVGTQVETSQYSYGQALIDGPDWLARALLESGYRLRESFEFFVGAYGEQSWRLLSVAAAGRQLEYQENRQGLFVRGEIELFSFLRLGFAASNSKLSYKELGPNPDTNEAYFAPLFVRSLGQFSVYSNLNINF